MHLLGTVHIDAAENTLSKVDASAKTCPSHSLPVFLLLFFFSYDDLRSSARWESTIQFRATSGPCFQWVHVFIVNPSPCPASFLLSDNSSDKTLCSLCVLPSPGLVSDKYCCMYMLVFFCLFVFFNTTKTQSHFICTHKHYRSAADRAGCQTTEYCLHRTVALHPC